MNKKIKLVNSKNFDILLFSIYINLLIKLIINKFKSG